MDTRDFALGGQGFSPVILVIACGHATAGLAVAGWPLVGSLVSMAGRVRKAKIGDVREIQKMLAQSARLGHLLPRSLGELYDNLRDIFVYVCDAKPRLIGTCSMHVCWEDLGEIRSLVVREPYRRQGIGRKLVEACISEAVALELYRIFVLTYQLEFFARLGFRKVDKATLPHKVWADCLKCPKFPECDEVAMILEL